ncbi:RNA polymerase sigma-70 factor, ECF subfamily [Pedobacter sp. ok626]|uniref:RNA polymerase sigma-70 factor n=1 Tax=Pedobacter sp. ok626 TaxID=1761882 RepID=UPI00088081D5|nr:RNA polymerase sigma-70 factor [Pedobacter sp. ok626]SDL35819.1 RNA polymerase sigma-70 factor, ECF subfamily [Pedobacter sp. ok626]
MPGSPTIQDRHPQSAVHQLDEQGFAYVYRNCWKSVFGIIFHYTRDEEIAEEISQDLFASIWERREKLIIKTSIEQYLNRAAKLEAFEYLRTSNSHRLHIDCALQNLCGSRNCTEEQVFFNALKGSLDVLVDELPCRCREVYRLSQEQGMNNKSIAAALLISEKTVEYHLYKAMSFLRNNLKEFR